MPKYIIERKATGVGQSSQEEFQAMSQKSKEALNQLGGQVSWIESFVTDDKIYCVYVAPNEDLIRKHAQLAGIPVDSIAKVDAVLDPSSGEIDNTRRSFLSRERSQTLQ
jgi:hypothetical protein